MPLVHGKTAFWFRFAFTVAFSLLLMPTCAAQQEDHPAEDAAKFKLQKKANAALPTLYLIGDSTMKVGTAGQKGWGDEMAPYFDLAKINVVNEAIGGRSSRTFQSEGRWEAALALIQKGDFVVIQFGHNDAGAINDNFRARASIKGGGDETEEIDNILTKKHEVVHSFGWYMRKYARDVQAKAATPIIFSLVPRNSWSSGKVVRAVGGYGGWASDAAKATNTVFVDHNEIIAEGLEKLGPEKTLPLFGDAKLHASPEGAAFNARAAVSGLKAMPGNPLGPYFSARAEAVPAFAGASASAPAAPSAAAPNAPVTLIEDAATFTIANAFVTAQVDKRSGGLVSLRYQGLETLNQTGHAGAYWSHSPGGPQAVSKVTIDPKTTNGSRAEVSVKSVYAGKPQGSGPGGSTACDLEVRYTLGQNDSGIYTYEIFTHRPDYPATSIGEARFLVKLNDALFDYMTVDARRRRVVLSAYDWNHGTPLNMKEARRMNTGPDKGKVEHKYDDTAVQFDTPAFGWSSTAKNIGVWFVNPTTEYLSGGPTKLELVAHRDATFTTDQTAPAPPCLLNYWRGSHYGGSECEMASGEAWTKVIGPFLVYCNGGGGPDGHWKDALDRAKTEAHAWPYDFVAGVDYPTTKERGTVSGQIVLRDPLASRTPQMSDLLVGLAHPDYVTARGTAVEWQNEAKYYQFWVRGDRQNHFTIPAVRPGTYTLHAIANGVLGEYASSKPVTVAPGQVLDLGKIEWTPVRYGRQVWEIGVPDRTAGEFLHGDHYYQWGLYNQYPKDFPNDVHYVVDKSDYHKDWNYAQVPHASDDTGRSTGPPTTWTISFAMNNAPLSGKATLRIALAGSSTREITVGVNGQTVGTTGPLPDTATIRRDAIRGYWRERAVSFDAALLKQGENTLTLTIPAGGVMSGVQYDYLRLELDGGTFATVTAAPEPDVPRNMQGSPFSYRITTRVTVKSDGRHTEEITKSSGNDDIDRAVLSALARYKWRPAMVGGKPVQSKQTVTINFNNI